jgi:hypothetical protein
MDSQESETMSDRTIVRVTGIILDMAGSIILAVALLIMHMRLAKSRRIDDFVVHDLNVERKLTYLALFLMVIGFAMVVITELSLI